MKNGLKFWSLALIVALIAGFASCKKDDNKEKEPNIEGQWKLDKNAPTIIPSLNQCELDDASNFRNFMKGGEYQELNNCGTSTNPIITGTWEKNGNDLTIKSGDNTTTYSIVLTEDNLVIKLSVSGGEVYNRTYIRVK